MSIGLCDDEMMMRVCKDVSECYLALLIYQAALIHKLRSPRSEVFRRAFVWLSPDSAAEP